MTDDPNISHYHYGQPPEYTVTIDRALANSAALFSGNAEYQVTISHKGQRDEKLTRSFAEYLAHIIDTKMYVAGKYGRGQAPAPLVCLKGDGVAICLPLIFMSQELLDRSYGQEFTKLLENITLADLRELTAIEGEVVKPTLEITGPADSVAALENTTGLPLPPK